MRTFAYVPERFDLAIKPSIFRTLGSEPRLQILLMLALEPEDSWVTTYRVGKLTFLDRKVARKHLQELVKDSLVLAEIANAFNPHQKEYQLNRQHPAITPILQFFHDLRLTSHGLVCKPIAPELKR